jgi:hypothetical protein
MEHNEPGATGKNRLHWIGIGCFGLVILTVILIVCGVWYIKAHYNTLVADTVIRGLPEQSSPALKDGVKTLILDIFAAKEAGKIDARDIALIRDKFDSYYQDKHIDPKEFNILEKDVRSLLEKANITVSPSLNKELEKLKRQMKGEEHE